MRDKIVNRLEESIKVKKAVIKELAPQIEASAKLIIEALNNGNKLLTFGNGGSAADAQHIAAEFIGRYRINRKALPAIALTTDSSILTCLSNDFGFDTVFARQIEGLANKGDILLGISTSGNSKNIVEGFKKGKEIGCKTIGLLGCGGGSIAQLADIPIVVPSNDTPRIQESHITIGHIICGLIEEELFSK
jgi:D-sedoheptulose 7-phosphate isomerase